MNPVLDRKQPVIPTRRMSPSRLVSIIPPRDPRKEQRISKMVSTKVRQDLLYLVHGLFGF